MNAELTVELFARTAGQLDITNDRTPEDWSFRYREEFLAADSPVALSVSLPLRRETHQGAVVRNWFCNLLPEGPVREAVVARLRIPGNDDFALLAAIGGECAGAVTIAGQRRTETAAESQDLETVLHSQGGDAGDGAWALAGTPQRLSLAGAQDKIAVIAEDGRLRLPGPGEFSTHIVKPDSTRFRGLRDLEAFGLALAREVGLDAVAAQTVQVAGRPALLVRRYDRGVESGNVQTRLHQEDFCQILGYPAEMKYEINGGPALSNIAGRIRTLALGPRSVQGFLDWVVFNALIGNADAHAKNLSLLCDAQGRRWLAPLYDLVPTIVMSERLVDRTPALRIGAAASVESISGEDWKLFASQCGYGAPYVLRRVRELGQAVLQHGHDVHTRLADEGADPTRSARALEIVQAQVRKLLSAL